MEIVGIMLSLIGLLFNVITLLKLEIVLLPWFLCEMFGASAGVTGTVVSLAGVAWIISIIRMVTDVFKKNR